MWICYEISNRYVNIVRKRMDVREKEIAYHMVR